MINDKNNVFIFQRHVFGLFFMNIEFFHFLHDKFYLDCEIYMTFLLKVRKITCQNFRKLAESLLNLFWDILKIETAFSLEFIVISMI